MLPKIKYIEAQNTWYIPLSAVPGPASGCVQGEGAASEEIRACGQKTVDHLTKNEGGYSY